MADVTYDDRSFLIDGKRVWLVGGSVHYSRIPNQLWRDRLLKARRAGLNCVCTPLPWSFHEPVEGKWDFDDDRDVATFVRIAGDLGLFVIIQPGPFIGADWDFGGLPGWLTTKTGIAYRSPNAAYTHYFDKYLQQALGRLADMQASRGGPIVAVQAEHRYFMRTMPDRKTHLDFVAQMIRRAGFETPILTCNELTDPPVEGAVETVIARDRPAADVKRLIHRPHHGPMVAIELRSADADRWGRDHNACDARDLARRALETLGAGAQYSVYPFCGGTNFDFWGGRATSARDAFQITSYDLDAPVAEGGGLTDAYYLLRLVNMPADHLGGRIAPATPSEPGVTLHDTTDVLNVHGPEGDWAVVTANGRDDVETARVALPDGTDLTVPLAPLGAVLIGAGVELTDEAVLDYANLMPLGLFGETLVLHGPAGWDAHVSVNGRLLEAPVPAGEQVGVHELEGLKVVLINSDLAMRTWYVDRTLVFGPTFVGEDLDSLHHAPKAKQYTLIDADGEVSRKKVGEIERPKRETPRLGKWTRMSVCTEPSSDELEWESIGGPATAAELGVPYGYLWYRAEFECERARKRNLMLPDCADRAIVYVNGELAGTWGVGEDASTEPISASLRRGANVLTVLTDNMGRFFDWPKLGGWKGLFGGVYDAKVLRTRKPKIKQLDESPSRVIPRGHAWMADVLTDVPVHEASVDLSLEKVTPVRVAFADLPHHAALICNGRTVGFFPKPRDGDNFAAVTLGAELKKGKNSLRLVLWGDVTDESLSGLTFHALTENLTDGATWSVRRWRLPEPGGPVVGKGQPAWYVAKFKYTRQTEAVFFHVAGAKKGQIFLNGRNCGRFWIVEPQRDYYLPKCWLREENELLVFEESGAIPSGSKLVLRPNGPFRE